jgi:hypothetical protein
VIKYLAPFTADTFDYDAGQFNHVPVHKTHSAKGKRHRVSLITITYRYTKHTALRARTSGQFNHVPVHKTHSAKGLRHQVSLITYRYTKHTALRQKTSGQFNHVPVHKHTALRGKDINRCDGTHRVLLHVSVYIITYPIYPSPYLPQLDHPYLPQPDHPYLPWLDHRPQTYHKIAAPQHSNFTRV